jgi:hypothetical protein
MENVNYVRIDFICKIKFVFKFRYNVLVTIQKDGAYPAFKIILFKIINVSIVSPKRKISNQMKANVKARIHLKKKTRLT